MTDLKPCPFCGGDVELVGINVQRQKMMFVCGKCGAEVVLNDDVEWNTRHYPADVQKMIERDTPKKLIRKRLGNLPVHVCPGCGYSWDSVLVHEMRVKPENCPRCGQALNWSDDE